MTCSLKDAWRRGWDPITSAGLGRRRGVEAPSGQQRTFSASWTLPPALCQETPQLVQEQRACIGLAACRKVPWRGIPVVVIRYEEQTLLEGCRSPRHIGSPMDTFPSLPPNCCSSSGRSHLFGAREPPADVVRSLSGLERQAGKRNLAELLLRSRMRNR